MLKILSFRTLLFQFCKFKHYKQLANEINYILPKINEELGFKQQDLCWIVGYKVKNKLPTNDIDMQSKTIEIMNKQSQNNQPKQAEEMLDFEIDPLARQMVNFGQLHKYAQANDLDVCITDPEEKQVTFMKLRQQVYRKYYYQRVFKAKSTARKYKQIRIPQNISEHDMKNKVANILQLLKKGQFQFKIYTENDSKKSQKSLKKICEMLGKNDDIEIQEYEIQEKAHRKPAIVIDRWSVTLNFQADSKVNYEQVNKKWKRHLIDLKLSKTKKQNKFHSMDGLINQPIQIQKQVISNLRQIRAPLPKGFEDYERLQDELQFQGNQAFMKSYKNSIERMQEMKKFEALKRNKIDKISQIQQQYEQKQLEDQNQISSKAKQNNTIKQNTRNKIDLSQVTQQQLKNVRKQMKRRTVEDILQQMQEISGQKVELTAFETYKIKLLEKQLKQTLQLAGHKTKN